MAGRFSIEAVFKAIDRVSAPVSKMSNRVGKFTRKMARGFHRLNRQVNKFGQGLKTVARNGAIAFALMGAATIGTIATFADFEQTLVNAAAKFPEAIERGTVAFKALEDSARTVGRETEFRASQAASGLNFLAMAGFNADQAIAALPGLVDLATASTTDLAFAADVATDTLGAFGLKTNDAAQNALNLSRINDVLAATTTSANTDMEQLFETMKTSGPVVKGAGGDIETFAALAGTLADSGLKGSAAGTAMKNAFIRLSAPASRASKLLRLMKVETEDGSGNLRDMFSILGDMETALDGVGSADRAKVLNEVFGLRAIVGGNILLEKGFKGLNKYRDALRNANGTAKKMADTMRDTMLGRWKAFQSAVESVQISLTKLKQGGIEKVIESLTRLTRNLDQAINANEELAGEALMDLFNIIRGGLQLFAVFIAAFVVMKTVVLAAQFGVIAYTGALLAWKAAVWGLALAMPILTAVTNGFKIAVFALNVIMMLNPIGLMVAAVVALIAVGVLLWAKWDAIGAFFSDMWDGIKDSFSGGIDFITSALDLVLAPLRMINSGLSGIKGKVNVLFSDDRGEEDENNRPGGQKIVSPEDRVAKSIEERRTTSDATLTIHDETGRGELEKKGGMNGIGLKLEPSGGF